MTDLKGGVLGTAEDNNIGVRGQADGDNVIGVCGRTASGYGVLAQSSTGVSLSVTGAGRILQQPRLTAGAPNTGTLEKGEQIRDVNGELWLCVADSTTAVRALGVGRRP